MTHTVKPHETVYSISRLYGITEDELRSANGIGNVIKIGQILTIPPKGEVISQKPLSSYTALKISLYRFQKARSYTSGDLTVKGALSYDKWVTLFECKTLELPWLNNEPQKSCIPSGTYPLIWEYSEGFKRHLWELKQVPNRSEVKIHPSNYVSKLRGCIAVGKEHIDINNDGVIDVTDSAETLKQLHSVLDNQRYLVITIE